MLLHGKWWQHRGHWVGNTQLSSKLHKEMLRWVLTGWFQLECHLLACSLTDVFSSIFLLQLLYNQAPAFAHSFYFEFSRGNKQSSILVPFHFSRLLCYLTAEGGTFCQDSIHLLLDLFFIYKCRFWLWMRKRKKMLIEGLNWDWSYRFLCRHLENIQVATCQNQLPSLGNIYLLCDQITMWKLGKQDPRNGEDQEGPWHKTYCCKPQKKKLIQMFLKTIFSCISSKTQIPFTEDLQWNVKVTNTALGASGIDSLWSFSLSLTWLWKGQRKCDLPIALR